MNTPLVIHAVVFRGRKHWVAQCLEYDIATQSVEPEGILEQLEKALDAEVEFSRRHDLRAFVRLPKAPEPYWQMARELSELDRPSPAPDPVDGLRGWMLTLN